MRLVFGSANLMMAALLSMPACGKREGRSPAPPPPAPPPAARRDEPSSEERQTARPAALGEPAPEIACLDLHGQPLRLSDQRGKVVLLTFWAEW